MILGHVKRRDPYLGEALDGLNLYYERANGDQAAAFAMLSKGEHEFIETEIERCGDARYYLENYHVVNTESEGLKTLHPFWEAQDIFYDRITTMQQHGEQVKLIVLKARQEGISTLTQGLLFHGTAFRERRNTMVVAQDPDTSDFLFQMSRLAYDYLPWWMRPEERYNAKGKYLVFDRKDPVERQSNPGLGSQLLVEAANKMCLTAGTMVPTLRGLLPIELIIPGDFVFDPHNKPVEVVAAIEHKPKNKSGVKLTVWHNQAFPVAGTPEHPIVTEHGLKELKHIAAGDKVYIPFRKIARNFQLLPVPNFSPFASKRKRREPTIVANRELGFMCGLYLAEGSIDRTNTSVQFSLSEKEEHFAERVERVCGIPFSKPIRSGGSLVCRLNSAYLATWLSQQFGVGDSKHVPSWVYEYGEAFCAGLLEGALRGDGHFCKNRNDVIFVTTRPDLALGIRDLSLSLGVGLASINKSKTAWTYKGERRTGIAYRVEFGGEAAEKLRELVGEPTYSVKRHLRNSVKWGWESELGRVWVKVKSTEPCAIDTVYDIQVASADHLYLVPACITHNTMIAGLTLHNSHMSELALWYNAQVLTQGLFPMMNAPDGLYILESTAKGRNNFWHRLWKTAIDGKGEWKPVFIEWFRVKKYSFPLPKVEENSEPFKLSKDEELLKSSIVKESGITLTDEQIYWRRRKGESYIATGGDDYSMLEQYPSNWREAFQSSGLCAFDRKKLHKLLETTVAPPRWYGEIDLKQGQLKAINLRLKATGKIHNVDGKKVWRQEPGLVIPAQEEYGGRLRIWEAAEKGEQYMIAADVAHGIKGGDFSCAQVLKKGKGPRPDVQVAEWHGWITATIYARVLAALGWMYGGAMVACESNDIGMTTNVELRNHLQYENLFQWKHYDKVQNFITDWFGWYTNSKTRPMILTKFRESIMDDTIVLRSADLLEQCFDFGSADGNSRYEGLGEHDDRVMAMMIARFCAHDSDWGSEGIDGALVIPEARDPRNDFYNTDYSPVHDKQGAQYRIARAGVDPAKIPPDRMLYDDMDRKLNSSQDGDDDYWKTL